MSQKTRTELLMEVNMAICLLQSRIKIEILTLQGAYALHTVQARARAAADEHRKNLEQLWWHRETLLADGA